MDVTLLPCSGYDTDDILFRPEKFLCQKQKLKSLFLTDIFPLLMYQIYENKSIKKILETSKKQQT